MLKRALGFFRSCWTLILPYFLAFVASTYLFFTGHRTWATVVANVGTLLALFVNLAYIAFYDSKKKWPDLSLGQRLTKLFTFRY